MRRPSSRPPRPGLPRPRVVAVGVILIAGLTAATPAVLAAQPTTTVVYPTGTFPQDVTNVQAAIDRGGKVLLKSVDRSGMATPFDFGPAVEGPGYVVIGRNVDLVGERTRRGATTIEGGWDPVSGFSSARVSVRDIDFKGPLDGALLFIVPGTARTLITGNRVSHVVGAYRTPDRTTAEAIVVSGGIVSIDDNAVTEVDADAGSGISEFGSSGPVEILRNRVSGTSMHAIEASGPGSVRIAGNVLRPGTTRDAFPGFGIEVNGPGTFLIRDNDVLVESPTSIGIWAFGALGNGFGEVVDPVIAHNHVVLRPVGTVDGALYDDGIDLAGRVAGADVSANTIEGSGATAFSLFDLALDPAAPSDLGSKSLPGEPDHRDGDGVRRRVPGRRHARHGLPWRVQDGRRSRDRQPRHVRRTRRTGPGQRGILAGDRPGNGTRPTARRHPLATNHPRLGSDDRTTEGTRPMTNLLHVISTPRGFASNTGRVSNALLEALCEQDDDLEVTTLDLFKADLPSVAGKNIESKYMLMTGQVLDDTAQASWRQIERTIEQFLEADVYLLTVPMWNLGIPYALKYYIDAIVQPGYLFRYDEHGVAEGLVHGKKMICVSSRGGDYSSEPYKAFDFVECYLRAIFGFVGITGIRFFNVQPMDMSHELRVAAQRQAVRDVRDYAKSGAWRPTAVERTRDGVATPERTLIVA